MASLEDAQLQMEQVEDLLATIMDERAALDAWEEEEEAASPPADCESSSGVEEACEAADESAGERLAASPVDAEDEHKEEEKKVKEGAMTLRASSPTLSLSLLESADRPVQWDLISPWSEADEDDAHDEEDEDVGTAFVPQRGFFKDESVESATMATDEPEAEMHIEERLRELIKSESVEEFEHDEIRSWAVDADEDDEEFEVFNVSALARTVGSINELFEEKLDSSASSSDDYEEKADDARTSVASTLDDSCEDSPRVSAAARFLSRRLRAQSYTGTAATSMQSAFAKFRSRTLSSTRSSFRDSSQASSTATTSEVEDAAGDFTGSFDMDAAGSSSHSFSRYALPSRLGSVGSLKMAAGRMSFLRFRSSSATTTTSEDSFCTDAGACTSPVDTGEVHSAPSLSSIRGSSASPSQPSNNHLQMQTLKLKASAAASKAAVYLNAASSEAARKLKSRSLRSPPAASEDDESPDDESVATVLLGA